MKRPFAFFAVALAGCFSPDDIFVLDGTVASAQPAGNVVRMLRGRPQEPDSCAQYAAFKETRTNADGRYVFEVFRAQAQGLTDGRDDRCFKIEVEFASGSRASAGLRRLFGPETMPVLPDWRPGMWLDAGTLGFTPIVVPLPGDTLEGDLVTHRLEARTEDGGLAWRQEDLVAEVSDEVVDPRRVPLTFEPALLVEDQALTLRLRANVLARPVEGSRDFGGRALALPVEVEAGELLRLPARSAPPSRGSPCEGVVCALTDGDYRASLLSSLSPTEVTVTFAAPLTPRWVVLRGLVQFGGPLELQLTGADGGTVFSQPVPFLGFSWPTADPLADSELEDGGLSTHEGRTRFVAVPIDAGVLASGLRLGGTVRVPWLGEVSVLE